MLGLILAAVIFAGLGIIALPAGIAKLIGKAKEKKKDREVEKSLSDSLKCPECGAENSGRAEFCKKCGYEFSEAKKKEDDSSSTKLKVAAVLSVVPVLGLLVSPFTFLSGYFRRRNKNPTHWLFKLGLAGLVINWGAVLGAIIAYLGFGP